MTGDWELTNKENKQRSFLLLNTSSSKTKAWWRCWIMQQKKTQTSSGLWWKCDTSRQSVHLFANVPTGWQYNVITLKLRRGNIRALHLWTLTQAHTVLGGWWRHERLLIMLISTRLSGQLEVLKHEQSVDGLFSSLFSVFYFSLVFWLVGCQ